MGKKSAASDSRGNVDSAITGLYEALHALCCTGKCSLECAFSHLRSRSGYLCGRASSGSRQQGIDLTRHRSLLVMDSECPGQTSQPLVPYEVRCVDDVMST